MRTQTEIQEQFEHALKAFKDDIVSQIRHRNNELSRKFIALSSDPQFGSIATPFVPRMKIHEEYAELISDDIFLSYKNFFENCSSDISTENQKLLIQEVSNTWD